MKSGLIFDIQRFSSGNGSGIRTTVFLSGCPLRCKWCHNPEGLTKESKTRIDRKLCRQCGICAKKCPRSAHVFSKDEHYIKYDDCINCNQCIEICCYGCITQTAKKYSVDELVSIIMADVEYYKHSGGGVTFSGGEPLTQYEFISLVIDKLDDIHVVMDTSGYCDSKNFIDMLALANVVQFDIKHMDDEKHKDLTGVGNGIILKNLEVAVKSGKEITIRYPMISGVNDSDENISIMASLLKGYGIKSIEVVLYHDYGAEKYLDFGESPAKFKKYSKAEENDRMEFIKRCGIIPTVV